MNEKDCSTRDGYSEPSARTQSTCQFRAVLCALYSRGYKPRGSGGNWRAQCPAHGGDGHNLSLREGRDGKALLKCFSRNCGFTEVLAALGLNADRPVAVNRKNSRGPVRARAAQEQRVATARRIWAASVDANATPGRKYLAGRHIWPPEGIGPKLPPDVRWLPASADPGMRKGWSGLPEGTAGALLFAFRLPSKEVRAIGVEGLCADGTQPTERFRRKVGTLTSAVFSVRRKHGDCGVLAIVEGEVSAIAASWYHMCDSVAVGGTSGLDTVSSDLVGERHVIIDVDGDGTGRVASTALRGRIAATGGSVECRYAGAGRDVADALAEVVRVAIPWDGLELSWRRVASQGGF